MAHLRLLFVGTMDNLNQIYANCPDSSSESKAEMAFGADYISTYNEEYYKNDPWSTPEFTKENKELYQEAIDGQWFYCFDIRDTNNYGDFGWVNHLPMESEAVYDREIEERNHKRVCDALKELPDGTVFFFADSHW